MSKSSGGSQGRARRVPGLRQLRGFVRRDRNVPAPSPSVEVEPPPAADVPESLGDWYHRIELPDGTVTPGDRDQSLVYALYDAYLPADLTGRRVLDLGANAGGLAIEFAKRGAYVTAVEYSSRYLFQAQWILEAFGLTERVELLRGSVYAIGPLPQYDIVCYLGLAYHLRHPQLALDLIAHHCSDTLLASSQTITGTGLSMTNRATTHAAPGHTVADRPPGFLWGWEPTEQLFVDMLYSAGFVDPSVVSTSPHRGETPGRKCGNRTYGVAHAASKPARVAIVDDEPLQAIAGHWSRL
jgi:2-polyprenyl-3-methyl-5-hydroxy-6-metoxy-1,4-benzoquinol methylase